MTTAAGPPFLPYPLCGSSCPNCGAPDASLVSHHCVVDGDPDALLGVLHCGCFYEGDPDKVQDHVSRSCWCNS